MKNDKQHIDLIVVVDSFTEGLAKLVAKHVAMLPESREEELLTEIDKQCSFLNAAYTEHVSKYRKIEAKRAKRLLQEVK